MGMAWIAAQIERKKGSSKDENRSKLNLTIELEPPHTEPQIIRKHNTAEKNYSAINQLDNTTFDFISAAKAA